MGDDAQNPLLQGFSPCPLELRREGGETRLRGSFPYGSMAVLSDGGRRGRPRKERFAPRAFGFRIEDPEAEIHLLAGHSFDRPLASKRNGTLQIRDTDAALEFEARITPGVAETSYGRDILALVAAGLATGISPGFRMPPERAVPPDQAERITEEPDNPAEGQNRAIIRTVLQALLFELSIVTRPAFPEAQVEARSWEPPKLVTPARRGLLL